MHQSFIKITQTLKEYFCGRRARVQSPVGSSPAFIIRLVDPSVVSKYELLKELTESNNELLVQIYDT